MDKDEFAVLRMELGIGQAKLGKLVGKSQTAISYYESGAREVPPEVAKELRRLVARKRAEEILAREEAVKPCSILTGWKTQPAADGLMEHVEICPRCIARLVKSWPGNVPDRTEKPEQPEGREEGLQEVPYLSNNVPSRLRPGFFDLGS